MGLFRSNCPECNAEHNWFLEAHGYDCQCGRKVTAKEVEDSWHKNYSEHLDRQDNYRRLKEWLKKWGNFTDEEVEKYPWSLTDIMTIMQEFAEEQVKTHEEFWRALKTK